MTDLRHPQLSGLGRNAAAPRDVLVRLAAHPAGRHGLWLRPGRLEDVVAEALLTHGYDRAALHLGGNRISPAMRRRIAGHPDPAIRDAYANFVRDMMDHGVTVGIGALEEAYGRPRGALVRAPDPKLRASAAQAWHDRPLAVQVGLLADPDPEVRAAAAARERPGVPPEWRERCLADPAVRVDVARYVPLTREQFARLMGSEEQREDILRALAGNPHLTAEMVALLVDVEDPFVRGSVARGRHVDAVTRDRLYALLEAERAAGSTEAKVALFEGFARTDWLREAPLAERLTYLDSRDPALRRALAHCRDLPEEAWRRLDDDPAPSVRRAAAHRPDVPPDVLERLVRAHGDFSKGRAALIDHPRFPRHVLRTFVDEEDPHVRCLALRDPELPVPEIRRLATATESFLRQEVARHPKVTEALLERLLSDPEPEVADDAAASPALRPSRMRQLLAAVGL
ncbi:hypothetical protein ACIRQY_27220 [Streptomyces sp. NPDC101490]|uniref:hypothetical protein n=1 Tax=Streptomyces sp. NPDC101490 TaxID=3366143 RepID=UPI00381CCF7A